MSTLEKIRKHPAIVIFVIGFAILLFIITGIVTSFDIFRDHDTVAKVDGTKLKYNELIQRTNDLQENYKQRGMSMDNIDFQQIEQEALEQLINETLLNNAVEELGITVTKDEMQALLFGETAIPMVAQRAQQYGFQTAEEFYQFAYSNDPQAEVVTAAWNEMEEMIREQLKIMKYQGQFAALTANKLDAQTYYNDNARTASIAVARLDYNTLPNDEFEVSESEIRERYAQDKEQFAIPTEQRLVDYILVRPTPSQDDFVAAQQEVEAVVEGLKTTDGIEAVSTNYNFEITNIHAPEASITDRVIKNAIPTMEADAAKVQMIQFANNQYTIGKILDSYVASDSVYVDLLFVDTTKGAADSIATELNKGTEIAALGEAITDSTLDFGMPLINTAFAGYRDQFTNAKANTYFVMDASVGPFANLVAQANGEAAVIARVKNFTDAVKIYEIAKITRKVEPSSTTLNGLDEALRTYIADNKTLDAFKDNSVESSYDVMNMIIDPSMLSILGLPESAKAARWAMENKKGSISGVFTDDNRTYMLVLAVEDIYKDYTPVRNSDVIDQLTSRIRAEKKGQKLVADYQGKANDLAGYAQLMNVKVDTIEGVNYTQDRVRGFVPGDGKLLSQVAAAQKGQVVGPFDTRSAAVVFEIIGEDMQAREFDYEQDAAQFNRAQGVDRLQRQFQNILRGNKEIDYSIQRFSSAN